MPKFEIPEIEPAEKEAPIKPGEIFDPEKELKRVQKIQDRAEKTEALKIYKEKLAYQKEGLAQMQEDVIRRIRANPDIPLEEIGAVIDDYINKYGLTFGQSMKINAVLESYSQKHSVVHGLREQFPDDAKLFEFVFAQPPKGEVEIVEGPMTLYFRCHNLEDLALISQQKFLAKEKHKRVLTAEDLKAASREGGVWIATSLIRGLEGSIIAENAAGRKFSEETSQKIHTHEEQHALKGLFENFPLRLRDVSRAGKLLESNKLEEKRAGLEAFFKFWRSIEEERAKDELLAYLKQELPAADILVVFTKTKEDGGLYDYFSARKKQQIESLVKIHGEKWRQLISETADYVYFFDYLKLLDNGINAYQELRAKGFSHEKAIAFLIGERLSDWGKVVARHLKF